MRLIAEDRDPDQIIRDLNDRIDELEGVRDELSTIACRYRALLKRAEGPVNALGDFKLANEIQQALKP